MRLPVHPPGSRCGGTITWHSQRIRNANLGVASTPIPTLQPPSVRLPRYLLGSDHLSGPPPAARTLRGLQPLQRHAVNTAWSTVDVFLASRKLTNLAIGIAICAAAAVSFRAGGV
jgi:hypothetical protein